MTRMLLLTLGLGVALAACAGVQKKETTSFEDTLKASGFATKVADTPERVAQLESMPQRKLLKQSYQGDPIYLYADAAGCNCLYAGSEDDYERLQKRIGQQDVADEEQTALDEAPMGTEPKWVDVEAYSGDDPLPWW